MLRYALDFTPEMYERALHNVEIAAEGGSRWPGLAVEFGGWWGSWNYSAWRMVREKGEPDPFQLCTAKGRGASCNEGILLGYEE